MNSSVLDVFSYYSEVNQCHLNQVVVDAVLVHLQQEATHKAKIDSISIYGSFSYGYRIILSDGSCRA